MIQYIVKRIALAAITLAFISIVSFVVVELPEGDYVDNYIKQLQREGGDLSMERAEGLRKYYGLDKPVMVRYYNWISRMILHLDFGYSFAGSWGANLSNKKLISEKLVLTVFLTAFTMILDWFTSIPIGIYSALRHNTIGDYIISVGGFIGLAVPDFLFGLLLMFVFFKFFHWSVGGLFSADMVDAPWSLARVADLLQHLLIPALVMGTNGAGTIRILRNNLLDELNKPYVVSARARGLKNWKIIVRYPVRLAVNPFISGIGGSLPALVGGSTIVSIVLSLPTTGPLLLNAIMSEDMYLAGTLILLLSALTIIGVLISDILLAVVDPRIRYTQ